MTAVRHRRPRRALGVGGAGTLLLSVAASVRLAEERLPSEHVYRQNASTRVNSKAPLGQVGAWGAERRGGCLCF